MMHTSEAECKDGPVIENVSTYRILPDAVRLRLRQCRLSGTDWEILFALLKYSHNGNRAAFPCNASLAREAGTSERNVQMRLESMEKKGVVRRTTATTEEAGATHRLIELRFLASDWTPQKSRPTTKKSGASTTKDPSWGGTKDSSPKDYENSEKDYEIATDGPVGAVAADSSHPRRKPSRPTRARRPARIPAPTAADLTEITDELIEAEQLIVEAVWGIEEWDQKSPPPTPATLLGETMPQTKAGIEKLAELHGRLLGDPGGVATYRNRIARALALDCKGEDRLGKSAMTELRKALVNVLRWWSWGRVQKPAQYFTKRADALLKQIEGDLAKEFPELDEKPTRAKSRGGKSTKAAASADTFKRIIENIPSQHLSTTDSAVRSIRKFLDNRLKHGKKEGDTSNITPANQAEMQNVEAAVSVIRASLESSPDLTPEGQKRIAAQMDLLGKFSEYLEREKRNRYNIPSNEANGNGSHTHQGNGTGETAPKYQAGDRVMHQQYGLGTVQDVETRPCSDPGGGPDEVRVTITFKAVGTRTFIVGKAPITRLMSAEQKAGTS